MDTSLLRYQVVIEVPSKGKDTVYYSSRVVRDVAKAIKGAGAKGSPPRLYCHRCFRFKCKTRQQLREHDVRCRFGGRKAHTPGCWDRRPWGPQPMAKEYRCYCPCSSCNHTKV